MKEFVFLLFISCFLFGPTLILSDDNHQEKQDTEQTIDFEVNSEICYLLPVHENDNLRTMQKAVNRPLKVTNIAKGNNTMANRNFRQKIKEKIHKRTLELEDERRDRYLLDWNLSFGLSG